MVSSIINPFLCQGSSDKVSVLFRSVCMSTIMIYPQIQNVLPVFQSLMMGFAGFTHSFRRSLRCLFEIRTVSPGSSLDVLPYFSLMSRQQFPKASVSLFQRALLQLPLRYLSVPFLSNLWTLRVDELYITGQFSRKTFSFAGGGVWNFIPFSFRIFLIGANALLFCWISGG